MSETTHEPCDPCHGGGSPPSAKDWPIGGMRTIRLGPVPEPVVVSFEPTLVALARAIGEWMPELGGRSIAVSEAEITAENVPTLPLAMVALQKETAEYSVRNNGNPTIKEDILVQYWVKPARYRRGDGSESPFWSFYDYASVRDRLLGAAFQWRSPRKARIKYLSMDIEAEQLAVVLTFRFEHEFVWCPPDPPGTPPCEAPEVCTLSWCISPGPPGS